VVQKLTTAGINDTAVDLPAHTTVEWFQYEFFLSFQPLCPFIEKSRSLLCSYSITLWHFS